MLEQAEEALLQEDTDKVIEHCRQSLRLRQSPMAHWLIGRAYFLDEDFGRAHAHFVFGLQHMERAFPLLLLDLSMTCLRLYRFDDAERYLNEYLAAEPGDADALELLEVMPRYREYRFGEPMDDLRAQLYIQEGRVLLGTGQESDREMEGGAFLSFNARNAARVLQRLRVFLEAARLEFDAVVAQGIEDAPVGLAVSRLLGIPMRSAEEIPAGGRVLTAGGVVRNPEPALRLRESLERRGVGVLGFALGAYPSDDEGAPIALAHEILGFYGFCAAFWYRVDPISRINGDRLAEIKAREAGVDIPSRVRRGRKLDWLRDHFIAPGSEEGSGDAEAMLESVLDPPMINPNVRKVAAILLDHHRRLEWDRRLDDLNAYYLCRHRRLCFSLEPGPGWRTASSPPS